MSLAGGREEAAIVDDGAEVAGVEETVVE